MNIKALKNNKEAIAEKVHDAWWAEKGRQGFHSPENCITQSAKDCKAQDIKSLGHYPFLKFHKFCPKCHADMYSYSELQEHVKDYDRVTVDAVIKAIEELNI